MCFILVGRSCHTAVNVTLFSSSLGLVKCFRGTTVSLSLSPCFLKSRQPSVAQPGHSRHHSWRNSALQLSTWGPASEINGEHWAAERKSFSTAAAASNPDNTGFTGKQSLCAASFILSTLLPEKVPGWGIKFQWREEASCSFVLSCVLCVHETSEYYIYIIFLFLHNNRQLDPTLTLNIARLQLGR